MLIQGALRTTVYLPRLLLCQHRLATGQLGCLMVRYFLADQPQNFQPLLDSGTGMLITLLSKNL